MYSSKIFIHSFISSFGISFLIASTKNKSESKLSVQGRSNSHTHTQKVSGHFWNFRMQPLLQSL